MTNILTNSAALKSLYHLNKNEGASAQATERLASGQRINKAGDDAAGAAIVNRMTSQISGMEVAIRNAGDAISMAQVAEGALNEVSEILQRMRELGVQSANGTYSGADRQSLNAEIVQLKKELIRIGESTTFNNTKLLNGTFQDTEFELGFDESPQHVHTLTIDDVRPSKLGIWNMSSQLEKSTTVSAVQTHPGTGTTGVKEITTSTSHGYVAGDQVTYTATIGIPGLVSGRTYEIAASPTPTDKMFALVEADAGRDGAGTFISYGSLGTAGTGVGDTFHLASLAGAPSVGVAGDAAPVSESDITEDMKVYGYVGTETISFPTKSDSRTIAEAVNSKAGTTGVSAYAETNARITVTPNNTSDGSGTTIVSFNLTGMNTTAKVISSTIKFGTGETNKLNQPDLSDLRDKINGYSGDTGISATLSYDKTYIDITSPDGYDIVIDNFDFPANSTTEKTEFLITHDETSTNDGGAGFAGADKSVSYNTVSNVTHFLQNAHGLAVGDMVRLSNLGAGNSPAAGVGSGMALNKLYFVKAVTANSFVLSEGSSTATAIDLGTTGTANDPKYDFTFQKMEKSLNLQTLDRDGNLKGKPVTLQDVGLGTNEKPDVTSSTRISGQIVYESPNVFTLSTGTGAAGALTTGNKTIFRDAPPSASLLKISDIDVLTVTNSQRMLSAVDGALRRIDAERGDLGATMNRMEHTIDNLSNIVMNTKVSKGRKADADMATESIELSKSRILQQAATSMLAQANKSMQSVLELLQ
jgi:flagellin